MNISFTIPSLKPLPKSSRKKTTTMSQNKFESIKNKVVNFEKKRFSRFQDEFKTKKTNLQEDLKEVDSIVKEVFAKKSSDDSELTSVANIDQIQDENDSFFEK